MFSTRRDCESTAYRCFWLEEFSARSVRKVTTGMIGFWWPSVHSNIAFWSFDVGSSYYCEAEFAKGRIVHSPTWAEFRSSWDTLVFTIPMTSHCKNYPAIIISTRETTDSDIWFTHSVEWPVMRSYHPLCLNASKTVSSLVKGGNDISRSLVSRKVKNNVTLLGRRSMDRSSHEPGLLYGASRLSSGSHRYNGTVSNGRTWVSRVWCRDSESSVDNLAGCCTR